MNKIGNNMNLLSTHGLRDSKGCSGLKLMSKRSSLSSSKTICKKPNCSFSFCLQDMKPLFHRERYPRLLKIFFERIRPLSSIIDLISLFPVHINIAPIRVVCRVEYTFVLFRVDPTFGDPSGINQAF
ncbi:hypothetical protein TNIN_204171 [Trichonephila inaurata madagascariensis]|uniref:Uncharacterized protein n=1 Tax=Trichonephila inaurata madagascariensis TaxID=2747483 RepID=A0A8X6WP75_9ARAC|nr:hypothetical protein TNIN_204171 [Trichonephila inaurata madagascariensis]